MARTRFRRKDLKRPDEFVSRGRQVILWAQQNTQLLYRVGAAIVVVVIAVGGYFSVRTARVRQANEDLNRALAEVRSGRYGEGAAQLADVAARWSATTPGQLATLYAASADIKANNFDTAALLLQDALDGRSWPPYLQQQALVSLAFALDRKGDTAGAATRYGEASAIAGPYTAMAILGEARGREQLGDKEGARKLYERLLREFPQAPESAIVTAKVGDLSQ